LNVAEKRIGYWNTNIAQEAFSGTLGTLDTVVTVPVSFTTIQIGLTGSGANQLFGTIRNVRIYQTQLSSAQLQAVTA